MYKCLVRPVADYSAVVYGPMLTDDQSDRLERLQSQVMKVIYKYNRSYRWCLGESELPTLKKRRENLSDEFVISSLKNTRFKQKWFPERDTGDRNMRFENRFVERFARTERLRKSPLYTMRRRAN